MTVDDRSGSTGASGREGLPTVRGRATAAERTHELDGLRGIAIALVVTLHSVAEFAVRAFSRVGLQFVGDAVFVTTYSGLELFFVLSGVLMLRPYLSEGRSFDGPRYAKRRVNRIWPPYLAALLFGGVVVWVAQSHATWYSRQLLPPFSFPKWLAQVGVVNLGWTSFNGAWWSLTLEVAFYVVVPVVALAGSLRRSHRGLVASIALVGAIIAVSYLWAPTPSRISPMGLVELGFQFLPCFALGALLARYDPSVAVGRALVAAGVVLVVIAIAYPSLNVHAAFALFWTGVVVLATRGRSRIRTWLAEPHLVWLGERSYSLFLLHFSVFYLVDYALSLHFPTRTAVSDILSRAVGLPLALLAAMVLFWVVERRLARGLVTAKAFWPWEVSPRQTGFHARRRSDSGSGGR